MKPGVQVRVEGCSEVNEMEELENRVAELEEPTGNLDKRVSAVTYSCGSG